MSFPKPSAPPYQANLYFESKTVPCGFTKSFYVKNTTGYGDSRAAARNVLNAYLPLMPPDVHCLKLSIVNNDATTKGDSFDQYFLTGEKSGTYAPTSGSDISPLDYNSGIAYRSDNVTNGVHTTNHIRPVPRTLVTDGKTLVADAAYQAALDAWADSVKNNVSMVTKSPGGTALVSTIDEVTDELALRRVPTGEPHFLRRGRARTNSTVAE